MNNEKLKLQSQACQTRPADPAGDAEKPPRKFSPSAIQVTLVDAAVVQRWRRILDNTLKRSFFTFIPIVAFYFADLFGQPQLPPNAAAMLMDEMQKFMREKHLERLSPEEAAPLICAAAVRLRKQLNFDYSRTSQIRDIFIQWLSIFTLVIVTLAVSTTISLIRWMGYHVSIRTMTVWKPPAATAAENSIAIATGANGSSTLILATGPFASSPVSRASPVYDFRRPFWFFGYRRTLEVNLLITQTLPKVTKIYFISYALLAVLSCHALISTLILAWKPTST